MEPTPALLIAVAVVALLCQYLDASIGMGYGTTLTPLLLRSTFSWKGLAGIGVISAVNKGITGGGYGPLVTGGQIVSGRGTRSSVGSTTAAEVVVCLVGFIAYMVLRGNIDWSLAAAVSVGSVVAAPFAALTVKKLKANVLVYIIGIATVLLGLSTLVRTYAF